jgi:hypothetical protein
MPLAPLLPSEWVDAVAVDDVEAILSLHDVGRTARIDEFDANPHEHVRVAAQNATQRPLRHHSRETPLEGRLAPWLDEHFPTTKITHATALSGWSGPLRASGMDARVLEHPRRPRAHAKPSSGGNLHR